MSTQLPGESTDRISDRERKLLTRLLSDPTLYPQAFKSWLVPYLEISDMKLPVSSVHGLLGRLLALETPSLARLPAGTVLLFDGDVPEGAELHPDPAVQAAAPAPLKFIRIT